MNKRQAIRRLLEIMETQWVPATTIVGYSAVVNDERQEAVLTVKNADDKLVRWRIVLDMNPEHPDHDYTVMHDGC